MYCDIWRDQPGLGIEVVSAWDHDSARLAEVVGKRNLRSFSNVAELLAQIDESYINRTVLMKYDEAHARFNLESMAARDQADFNAVITRS